MHSSVAFFMYFGAAVLVIVNGQPTTDNNIEKYEIMELRTELAKTVARVNKLERLLTAADKIDMEPDASKLNVLTPRLLVCV